MQPASHRGSHKFTDSAQAPLTSHDEYHWTSGGLDGGLPHTDDVPSPLSSHHDVPDMHAGCPEIQPTGSPAAIPVLSHPRADEADCTEHAAAPTPMRAQPTSEQLALLEPAVCHAGTNPLHPRRMPPKLSRPTPKLIPSEAPAQRWLQLCPPLTPPRSC